VLVIEGRDPQQKPVIETAVEQVDGEIQVEVRCQLTVLLSRSEALLGCLNPRPEDAC
jgi:hypothetical protein